MTAAPVDHSGSLVPVDLTRAELWHGVVELEDLGADGVRPWRLPVSDPRYDIGITHAGTPSGVRLAFTTGAGRLELALELTEEVPDPVDVVIDGVHAHRLDVRSPMSVALPGRPATVEVWLPMYGASAVRRLALDEPVAPIAAKPVRWITHGSSITMCHQADGPWTTWPARVARSLDVELLNLGFGGQCLIDIPVARLIRDLPADLISVCLGINVHGNLSHNRRSFLPAVLGFLETIRDGHPDTPLVVISPIAAKEARESGENKLGVTLTQLRDDVHDATDRIRRATGDDQLHLVDGRTVLGPDDLGLLVDDVHPGEDGNALIAERLAPVLAAQLRTVERSSR
ncbi:GDSL-type esterase/lipase family protein [Propionibacteriaceae bacterium Y2011]